MPVNNSKTWEWPGTSVLGIIPLKRFDIPETRKWSYGEIAENKNATFHFFIGKFRLLQMRIIVKNSSQLNRFLIYVYKFWFLSISLKKFWSPFRVILLLTQPVVRLMASHVWDISWCTVSGTCPISPLSLSDFTNLQINGFTLILT